MLYFSINFRILLISWFFLNGVLSTSVTAQSSIKLGEVFKDDVVPRIDLLMPQDSVDIMVTAGSQGSDHHFLGTMVFDNGGMIDTVERIGIRLRGNTSRGAQKKSFKISMNTYEPGRKFYGLEKLNINGEHNDPSIIRSKMSWDILREMGIPAPRANHVQLYINRQYVGLYIHVEHIDEEFVEDRFGSQDGNLYKCTFPAPLTYSGNNQNDYKKEMWGKRPYDLKTNTAQDDYSGLVNFIQVLNNPESSDFVCDLEQIFNVNAYLKVMAFDILSSNWDGPIFNQNNFYLYDNPISGQFEYIPFDLDNTFGIDWFIGDLSTRDIYAWAQDPNNRPIYTNLLKEPVFLNRFNYYMEELLTTTFNSETLNPYLDEKLELIKPFAAQDPFRSRDYGWSFSDFQDSYEMALGAHVEYGLKNYIQERHESALTQVNNSEINPFVEAIQNSIPFHNLPLEISANIIAHGQLTSAQLCYNFLSTDPVQCVPIEAQENTNNYSTSLTNFANNKTLFYYIQLADNSGMEHRFPYCGFQEVSIGESDLPLFINEFQAKNTSTISDEAGEYDDWIELYNAGEEAINLTDIYLTDNLDNPSKWALPEIEIAPKSYLLLWADEDQEQGPLHTNFKLSADGESIGLFEKSAEDFLPIDVIQYEQQNEDQTFGRIPDGAEEFRSMSPSPNNTNQTVSTSLDEVYVGSIQVMPNPSSSFLNILVKEELPSNLTIKIFSALGQEVFTNTLSKLKGSSLEWTNNKFPDGVYIVQFLEHGKIIGFNKIILQ